MNVTPLIAALTCFALPAWADVTAAHYETPTARYDHAILGDALEWADLVMQTDDRRQFRLSLPDNRVFEDVAPRVVPLPNEAPVVAVVETEIARGARLALYRETGLIAATPFIGQTHRWLAPIGAADLDGDGHIEFAYVDRPHLARTIRIWRYADGSLTEVAELPGYTNHRIGEDNIAGGIRDCGQGPQMIVASADWSRLFAIGWDGAAFTAADIGPHDGRASFANALTCG